MGEAGREAPGIAHPHPWPPRNKKNIVYLTKKKYHVYHVHYGQYTLHGCTVCPESSDPFCIVTYCIKWVTTSWTYCSCLLTKNMLSEVVGWSYLCAIQTVSSYNKNIMSLIV